MSSASAATVRSLHSKTYQVFIAEMVLARNATKVNQHDLARRLTKPQSFVSKYERGERRLDVPKYIHIVSALELDSFNRLRQIIEAIG
jgi:predicted transcriptional regulator